MSAEANESITNININENEHIEFLQEDNSEHKVWNIEREEDEIFVNLDSDLCFSSDDHKSESDDERM